MLLISYDLCLRVSKMTHIHLNMSYVIFHHRSPWTSISIFKEKVVGGISNISANLLSLLTFCSSSSPCFFSAWAPTWSLKTHKKYYIKNKYSSEQVIQTCAIKKLSPFLTMFDLCMNIFYNVEETSALTGNMAWVR